MQLIIKSSSYCDFNCSFCSSGKLDIPMTTKVHPKIKKYIDEHNFQEIIVNGGEPLLMSLSWWYDLLDYGSYDLCCISNMMELYNNTNKVKELFINPRISFGASFQDFGGRLYQGKNCSIEWFKEVNKIYYDLCGKSLFFIVVTEDIDNAWRMLELAQEMDTVCRINPIWPQGLSNSFFPFYKIMKFYLDVIDKGLSEYEKNVMELKENKCPFSYTKECSKYLRVCYVNSKDELVTYSCDGISDGGTIENNVINIECYSCLLHKLCNGCQCTRTFIKRYTPEHCVEMKNLEDRILHAGFAL